MEEIQKQLNSFMPKGFCNQEIFDHHDSESSVDEENHVNYVATGFRLPIDYLDDSVKHPLSPTVVSDLELVTGEQSMYTTLLNPSNLFSQQVLPLYQAHFTTDTEFLSDTQQVIDNMSAFSSNDNESISCNTLQSQWTDVRHSPTFKETYGYVDWSLLESFNRSSLALQGITLANMLSPLMSFFIPFLFFLFPFIILKIQGVPITFSIYLDVLKNIARHHFIGKAIATFESFSFQNLIYLLAMLGLYGLQMYQNTMQCLRFYRNIQKINNDLVEWKHFVQYSIQQIETFQSVNHTLNSYSKFNQELTTHLQVLGDLREKLKPIYPFQCSIMKSTDIGYMLKIYYELHTSTDYEKSLVFSMGFYGYLDHLAQLHHSLKNKTVQKACFISTNNVEIEIMDSSNNLIPQCTIEQQYYPLHKTDGIRNDVNLESFGVITGPNASGKTTYLKTTAINVILSQQFGLGFYQSCTMRPYSYIHSYLNIPDTSGRDSLFQAESRRCKEILQHIQNDNARQFCIFDELYSGTNPKEATKSAYAFLEFIRKYKHVDLFLTTHYVSICDQWTTTDVDKKPIQNYQMLVKTVKEVDGTLIEVDNEEQNSDSNSDTDTDIDTDTDNKTLLKRIPTYQIAPGISHIEGALGILQDMEYPEEMISMIRRG